MLQFEPGLAIYAIITFLVLFVILSKVVWPKILTALDEREATIRDSLDAAHKAKDEADRVKADYEEMIAKAKKESAEIIRTGTAQAEKVREELIAAAKEDARNLVENTKKELELEQQKAINEMKAKTIDISIAIATKIIKASMTPEKQVELAKQAMKEMELN